MGNDDDDGENQGHVSRGTSVGKSLHDKENGVEGQEKRTKSTFSQ